MIRAVTFDLWNTLLCNRDYGESRIDILRRILEKEGFSRDRDAVKDAYLSTLEFSTNMWREERRYVPVRELIRLILGDLRVVMPVASECLIVRRFEETIFEDPPPLMEHAETVLESLHTDYRIGLISNSGMTPGRILRDVLDSHGVLLYFSCTIFSDEVGYHKPHPLIFMRAIENLQVKAEEVIHVGDILESDIVGAKAVGMEAAWFGLHGVEHSREAAEFLPGYRIETLSQLLEILEVPRI